MRFAVVRLRQEGVRLGREETATVVPAIGELEVADWQEGNSAKRILRQALILERRPQYTRSLLQPLFDPVLIRMTERWFVLRGFEICSSGTGGAARECIQEWLVRPVTAELESAAQAAL